MLRIKFIKQGNLQIKVNKPQKNPKKLACLKKNVGFWVLYFFSCQKPDCKSKKNRTDSK